jgi:RND family efflux transporter MFP subunit
MKITIKIFLISFIISLLSSLLLSSCNTSDESDSLQSQLEEKKAEYTSLKLEINELQKKIQENDTTEDIEGIAVIVEESKPQDFKHYFKVNGSFEAIESAFVSPETSGQVKSMLVKEGDRVKKGQVLAKLNTAIIESSIREIKTALELSTIVYKKQKELWDKNIGSELDYLRAKTDMESKENKLLTLQTQLDMAIIKSPINGIVDQVIIKVGEMAMPGQMIIQIINLDEFYLNVEVSESYLPFIYKGDDVSIELLAYENKTIESKIYRISNLINPENRSFTVQAKLKNTDRILKPNMLAEAKFMDYEKKAAITVPSIIVKNDFNGFYLFAINKKNGKSVAHKVYVKTGRSQGQYTMIESGIKTGDLVITKGYNQVVEGSLVSIK